MKIDTFIQLIKDLRQDSIEDDMDPNNTILQQYTSPYDTMGVDDSVRARKSSLWVWGDGTTYTAYDTNNQAYQAPSCGWLWGSGGIWTGDSWVPYQNSTWSDLGSNTWTSL